MWEYESFKMKILNKFLTKVTSASEWYGLMTNEKGKKTQQAAFMEMLFCRFFLRIYLNLLTHQFVF